MVQSTRRPQWRRRRPDVRRCRIRSAKHPPTESIGATLVATHAIATEITAIDDKLKQIDVDVADRLEHHHSAEILSGRPGFRPVLSATFLGQIGSNRDGFDSVDRRLASLG
ncbi:hypothetical protein [Mycolicibacterium cosmeticum]|uniref:hypothetical protein n=1 Tax=Mycolicibacterium cosmeticum TaxID=258533 RepID=UPI0032047A93